MRFLLLLLAIASFVIPISGQDAKAPSPEELFAWYDRLGFEDLSKAKFARIWTGYAVMRDGVRRDPDVTDGFVLEDDGTTFRAVLGDLTLGTFKKSGADPAAEGFCGYQELSIEQEAARLVAGLKNPRYFALKDEEGSHFRYYDRLSLRGQVFVIARECARQNLPKLAEELIHELAIHPESDGRNAGSPFLEWLKRDFAGAIDWRGQLALRDPSKSWDDIRGIHQLIVDHCPESYTADRARKMVDRITRLLEKEKARKALPPDDPEELVWRLHEEQDDSIPDDYWPRPYPFEPRKTTGAMAALRKLGKEAVPALVKELNEGARLSRSASRSTRYGGAIWQQDTHHLALSVLNDIAGFRFNWLAHPGTPEGPSHARLLGAIDDWWRAIRRGEERQWLVAIVREGGRRGDAVADALLERYPADFFEAAVDALRASDDPEDPYPREQMLERLVKLKDNRVVPLLLEELSEASELATKVSLAATLRKLGNAEGESPIRDAFRAFTPADLQKPEVRGALFGDMLGRNGLLDFLLSSDSAESIRAVGDRWTALPFDLRLKVVGNLSSRNVRGSIEEPSPAVPATAQAAIRDLLLRGAGRHDASP